MLYGDISGRRSDSGGAETYTVMDDFESGQLSDYYGNKNPWSYQTSTVFEGGTALVGDDDYQILHKSEDLAPAASPVQGDTFECFMRAGGANARPGMVWCISDTGSNFYRCRIQPGSDTLELVRVATSTYGGNTIIASGSATMSTGTWYRCRVVWDDGTLGGSAGDMTATVHETGGTPDISDDTQVGELTGNDTALPSDSQGYGFTVYNNSTSEGCYYDLYRVVD